MSASKKYKLLFFHLTRQKRTCHLFRAPQLVPTVRDALWGRSASLLCGSRIRKSSCDPAGFTQRRASIFPVWLFRPHVWLYLSRSYLCISQQAGICRASASLWKREVDCQPESSYNYSLLGTVLHQSNNYLREDHRLISHTWRIINTPPFSHTVNGNVFQLLPPTHCILIRLNLKAGIQNLSPLMEKGHGGCGRWRVVMRSGVLQ